jgi:hypothetical protein
MWYVAEEASGDVYYIKGSSQLRREDFLAELLKYVNTCPEDEYTPRELTVFEFSEEYNLSVWCIGDTPPKGETWTTAANKYQIGQLLYEYPGEWYWEDSD